jgi:hypothetical protein
VVSFQVSARGCWWIRMSGFSGPMSMLSLQCLTGWRAPSEPLQPLAALLDGVCCEPTSQHLFTGEFPWQFMVAAARRRWPLLARLIGSVARGGASKGLPGGVGEDSFGVGEVCGQRVGLRCGGMPGGFDEGPNELFSWPEP